MNFVSPNYLNITLITGQSLLNSISKLEISDLKNNKVFKEIESLNTIDNIFNSNQEESSNYITVDMELKSNTA